VAFYDISFVIILNIIEENFEEEMQKILFVGLIFSSSLVAQTAYDFLKLDASARSASLGGSFVANIDDPAVIFYNPAGMNFVERNKITIGFLKHFLDANSGFLSYNPHIKKVGKIGLAFAYTNYGSFELLDELGNSKGNFSVNDLGLITNYSNLLGNDFSYGVNLKLIYSSIYNVYSLAFGFDAGLTYYDKLKQFSAGISFLNVGSQVKSYYNIKEKLPLDVRVGISKKLEYTPLRVFIEFVKLNEKSSSITQRFKNFIFGGEIYTSNYFILRFGYNNERKRELKIGTTTGTEGFNLGFGLNVSDFRFDYGLSSFGKAGVLHRINISTSL